MGILDYLRPNIFNNPVANSQGMYNPNKKTNKPEFLLGTSPLDSYSTEDIYSQLQKYSNTPNTLHGSDTPIIQQYNPPSIQNGKLIAGTPMEGSSPQIQSRVANAFDGVAQMNLDNQQLQNTNDPFSYQALKQIPQQEIAQNLFDNPQIQQSKSNILGKPTQKTLGGVTVTKDANGNPVFSNTTNPYEGMFTGMSKERDAALDSYGKVDKNSEFYKRNKQAMSNLGGGYVEEQNMLNAQRSKDNQDAMDLARFRY